MSSARLAWARSIAEPVVVLVLPALASVLFFQRLWLFRYGDLVGSGIDPDLFVWYMAWTPWAIAHGQNPMVTHHILAPAGANLMWNTSIILPSFLMWPATAVLGPGWSYDVLATLAPIASAAAAHLALRRHAAWPAALAGAVLYGFSPELLTQAGGHPMVTIAVYPPLALFLVETILSSTTRRRRLWTGAALGAATAAQLLISTEVAAITVISAVAGLAVLAALKPGEIAGRAPRLTEGLAAAAVVGVILGGVPLAFIFFGPQHVTGALQPQDVYVQDLAGLLLPGPTQMLAPASALAVTARSTGGLESAGYIGAPLLVFATVTVVALRRRVTAVWAFGAALVIVLLALGPHLHLAGQILRVPLPWRLFRLLPMLAGLVPARFMVVIYLPLGLLVALGLEAAIAARRRWFRAAALGGAMLVTTSLWPNPGPVEAARTPRFFVDAAATRIPDGGLVVISPIGEDYSAMRDQVLAGMRFRITGGGAFTPGPYFGPLHTPVNDELRLAEASPDWSPPVEARLEAMREELAGERVEAVIVTPQPMESRVIGLLELVLGSPPEMVDGVALWRLRRGTADVLAP